MLKRALVILALVAVVALPFALRPRRTVATAADDTVVVISPHNAAIREEFDRDFTHWYHAQTGRTVRIDWRVIGGTTDIARFLEATYVAAFEHEWVDRHHGEWSADVQSGFQNARLPADASAAAKAARAAFLASNVSCGIDVFFGGDAYEFGKQAQAGRLVDGGLMARHPKWFQPDVFPESYGGEPLREPQGRWFGAVLSQYGMIYNRDSLRRLGLAEPQHWDDMADPRLAGEVALADPTKSGSVCEAFENMIQGEMQRHAADPHVAEGAAIREGWIDGLRLIQRIGANARYFTDTSQKPPIDVADGDCAVGLCIDFYGRQQQEAVRRRDRSDRAGYITPRGGSAASADPIGLLRGAPHREVGVRFMEYVLSMEGQKLWAFRPGTPGGPKTYALRRMPIRRDFYEYREWQALRSDPDDAPYDSTAAFVYRPEWTGNLFREIGFVVRVMCQDTQPELRDAWTAIRNAPEPQRTRALAVLQDMSAVDYDQTRGLIHQRLNAKDRVEEVRLAAELGDWFRQNYRRAAAIARGTRDAGLTQ